jgi:hypothetical protein
VSRSRTMRVARSVAVTQHGQFFRLEQLLIEIA